MLNALKWMIIRQKIKYNVLVMLYEIITADGSDATILLCKKPRSFEFFPWVIDPNDLNNPRKVSIRRPRKTIKI